MPKPIVKGEHRTLNVTKQGNQRFFVGLSWDPREKKNCFDKLKEILSGKEIFHDLDLSCYLFDADQKCTHIISGKNAEVVNDNNSVYHSGDDTDGLGGGDDEQISVEVANLPKDTHHIVFKASIGSGHKFSEIETPEIRLVDAYSDRHIIKKNLDDVEGQKKCCYILAEIYRVNKDGEMGWQINYIDEYRTWGDLTQWKKKLVQFLTVQD